MEDIVISFVILDVKNHHLASLTIESLLNQTKKKYEIIVMVKDIPLHDFQILKEYTGKIDKIEHSTKENKSQIMNEALKIAKGKYLHFLFPGEVYLSKHSLEYVLKEIENNKYPDIVCFSFLRRDFLYPPEVKYASFSVTLFGKERFPIYLKDSIFSKAKIKKFKGFDKRYKGLQGFDMITKIYKQNKKVLCCRRVVVDFELQKRSSRVMVKYFKELLSIIYRNFGFFHLFHWYIIRETVDLFIWWMKGIKGYFIQTD